MRSNFIVYILLITLVSLVSCGSGSQSTEQPLADPNQETGAIGFQLNWSTERQPSPNQPRAAIDCGAMNVDSLSATVLTDTQEQAGAGGPWACSEGRGTIGQVPAGDNYTVVLSAYDADGKEIYRGETSNVSVQASQTVQISITMQAVEEPGQETGSIEIISTTIDCGGMTADSLSAVVLSDAKAQISAGGPWACSGEGLTIGQVPVGDNYTVVLSAYDADGKEIYRGETPNVSVQANQTVQISVSMEAIVPSTVSLVEDVNPGVGSSFPQNLMVMGNQLFFTALGADAGFELHVADLASDSVQLVKDIYPIDDALDRSGVVAPSDFVELNAWLYFRANSASGYRLWRTDGTTQNTEPVLTSANYFNPSELTVLNNRIYFAADSDTAGRELWVYDQDSGQAQPVADIRPGTEGSNPHELTAVGENLYYVANDGVNGYELWHTNGTITTLVQDLYVGAEGSYPRDLVEVSGRLFCVATNGPQSPDSTPPTYEAEVWMIYESVDSIEVQLTADINTTGEYYGRSRATNLTWINGTTLAFSAYEPSVGQELYLFDWENDAAPRRITDLNPNAGFTYPANFLHMGGILYFTAHNSNNVEHLWAYSLQQPNAFTCLTSSLPSPSPRDITGYNQTIYFTATDGFNNRGLWAYDGSRTAAVVGTDGDSVVNSPANLLATPDRLYFTAYDLDFGEELFQFIDN